MSNSTVVRFCASLWVASRHCDFWRRSNCITWSGWTVQGASSSERKQGSQVAQRGFIGMHVSGEQLILAQLIIRPLFFLLHIAKEPQMVEVWIFSQKWLWEQRQKKQLGFFSTYTWPHLNFCKYWSDESNQKNLCYLKFYQRLTNGWGGIFLTKPGYCQRNCWEGYASFLPITTDVEKERRVSHTL